MHHKFLLMFDIRYYLFKLQASKALTCWFFRSSKEKKLTQTNASFTFLCKLSRTSSFSMNTALVGLLLKCLPFLLAGFLSWCALEAIDLIWKIQTILQVDFSLKFKIGITFFALSNKHPQLHFQFLNLLCCELFLFMSYSLIWFVYFVRNSTASFMLWKSLLDFAYS